MNIMSILYKRFFLVAAMIAVMGVFTANLIQETRPQAGLEILNSNPKISCKTQRTCRLFQPKTSQVAAALLG